MSKFSGQQYRGASRVLKELKREEAEARQAAYNKRMADLAKIIEVNGEVVSVSSDEPFVGFDK